MVQLAKICPNCHTANPPRFQICRECGASLDIPTRSSPASARQPQKLTIPLSSTLLLETVRDWFGVYVSFGRNLQRFTEPSGNLIKFMIDFGVLTVLNGLSGLLAAAIILNENSPLGAEFQNVQSSFASQRSTEILATGFVAGLGIMFLTTVYLVFAFLLATFFDGKGDLADHFHLLLCINIGEAVVSLPVLLAGLLSFWGFLVLALLLVLYGYYLQVRVIQAVHQLSLPIALMIAVIAPIMFSSLWSFIT